MDKKSMKITNVGRYKMRDGAEAQITSIDADRLYGYHVTKNGNTRGWEWHADGKSARETHLKGIRDVVSEWVNELDIPSRDRDAGK